MARKAPLVDPESVEIGGRARMIRGRRGLSLDAAAGLAGISKPYLWQLENGKRRFARRGLIEDLAGALSCAVTDLTGQPYLSVDRETADAMAALPGISVAVNDCTLDDVPDLPARPVEQLVAATAQANAYLDEARFSLAGRGLGALLTELHVIVATGSTDARRAALAALAEACMVATSIARHLGHADLAVETARRGYDAARRLDDPTRTGLLAMHRALGLTWIGAQHRITAVLDEALTAITPAADPSAVDTGPAQAAGMLHLTAALHHAKRERTGDAEDHLGHANELACCTGECNLLYQHFGPAHVALWGVEVAVELGRGPATAERIDTDAARRLADTLGSANRRCVLHFDLARGWAQAEGTRDAEAIRHLDMADRITSQVRNVPVARDLLADLHDRARRRVWELDSLLNRFG
ncbi:MAG: helix-turn-helix domain-containing protein, partial [Pseudonocardiaceae bacterium]